MDAPTGSCAFCGKPARNAHHITGRAPDHSYLHDELTVELCHQHHVLTHNDLRAQHIDVAPAGVWTVTARIEHVLRRIATFLARHATYADNPVWALLAAVLQGCADEIAYIDLNLHGDIDGGLT